MLWISKQMTTKRRLLVLSLDFSSFLSATFVVLGMAMSAVQ
jgi:hypothetical protein